MPLFLRTCKNTDKTPAKCLSFELEQDDTAMMKKVVAHTLQWFTEVPVLIIAQGELNRTRVRSIVLALWLMALL